jgi:hypothetical protein
LSGSDASHRLGRTRGPGLSTFFVLREPGDEASIRELRRMRRVANGVTLSFPDKGT